MSDTQIQPGGTHIPDSTRVATDQTTVTGDGSSENPLRAVGGGGGSVHTDATLLGDGTLGDVLGVNVGHIPIVSDGSTITGDGTLGSPLISHAGGTVHTDATLTGDGSLGSPLGTVADKTAVLADGTSIAGTGVTSNALHTIDGGTGVATDGTLTGNGKTGNPLHVVGGGGGLIAVYRPPTPADGDVVALHAGAINVVDIQNVSSNGLLLQLPAASGSPAGTPLQLALVNMGAYSSAQRGPFTIRPGVPGINAIVFAMTGGDTINGVTPDAIFAVFSKSGDNAQLYSDGISDWIVAGATWTNVQHEAFTLVVSGLGNQLSTESDGPVPNQIYLTANADGTQVISLSAGYFGQICTLTNVGTHAFLIVPDEIAIPLTNNCCYLTGNAQDYRLDPGESLHVQFGQRTNGGVPNLWYVIGHNTLLS